MNGILGPKFRGFRTRPEVKDRNAENTLGLCVPIWPSPIDDTPCLAESLRSIAIGPNAAVLHRNIVRRCRSKDLSERRSGKALLGNRFGDCAADHNGVPMPFIESWNGCRAFLGNQCRNRLSLNERMVYREEDELAPIRVIDQVLQPKHDRSKHVQSRLREPQGLDRIGNVTSDIWWQSGCKGRQSTSVHDLGTCLQKGSAVRKMGEGLGSPESAPRASGKNQPRRWRT